MDEYVKTNDAKIIRCGQADNLSAIGRLRPPAASVENAATAAKTGMTA